MEILSADVNSDNTNNDPGSKLTTLVQFLRTVLPEQGNYVVAKPFTPKEGKATYSHHDFIDVDAMARYLLAEDGKGRTTYFAMSAYRGERKTTESGRTPLLRTQDNVRAIKAFWLDLDIKTVEGKVHHITQAAALRAVMAMSKALCLGNPLVVNSGGGLHVYWVLSREIERSRWEAIAHGLQAACKKHDVFVDDSRTTDCASILRPVGTHNYKKDFADGPREVRWRSGAVAGIPAHDVIDPDEFAEKLQDYMTEAERVIPVRGEARVVNDVVDEFAGGLYDKDAMDKDAEIIASRCAQVGALRDCRGNVEEPLWYAMLGVLTGCKDGEAIAQEWSSGHPGYDPGATAAKFEQWKAKVGKPTTCDKFKSLNAAGCAGCQYAARGDITSPMRLGYELAPGEKVSSADSQRETVHIDIDPTEFGADASDPYDWEANTKNAPLSFPEPFPGAMEDMVNAALANAPKPQPELTTLAVLIGMASACGSKVELPSGMRCNLYGAGVADSGWGKDLPIKACIKMALASGGNVIGKPASGQGLEDSLVSGPGMLIEIDEVAHLFESLNNLNRTPALIELSANLLKLFTASQGSYHTRVKAAAKGVKPPTTIQHPCMNLFGIATPQKLGEALTSGNIVDGLLGRMMFARGRDGVRPRRVKTQFKAPHSVDVAGRSLSEMVTVANFEGARLEFDADADAMLDELLVTFDDESQQSKNPIKKALLIRSYEKVERISGVLAMWDRFKRSELNRYVIKAEHITWAERAVRASNDCLLEFCNDYLADGQTQAWAQKVLMAMTKVLEGSIKTKNVLQKKVVEAGLAPWSLVLDTTRLDAKQFKEAVEHLEELEAVEVLNIEDSGAKKKPKALKRK